MWSVTTIQTREAVNLANIIQENMHPYHTHTTKFRDKLFKISPSPLNMPKLYLLNNIKLTFRHARTAIDQWKNGGKMGKGKNPLSDTATWRRVKLITACYTPVVSQVFQVRSGTVSKLWCIRERRINLNITKTNYLHVTNRQTKI